MDNGFESCLCHNKNTIGEKVTENNTIKPTSLDKKTQSPVSAKLDDYSNYIKNIYAGRTFQCSYTAVYMYPVDVKWLQTQL